jgi:(E)-4-hydroxy-3-methylbut-2-enyl-diphosphate synthase
VHFDHLLALASLEAGASGIRINPGNIGGEGPARAVAERAAAMAAAVRIGVNSGSLQRDLRGLEEKDPAGALVESALRFCDLFESFGFENMKFSVKSSSPAVTIDANRRLARRLAYPLHLGVTEAGTAWAGSIRSAVALGTLLAEGVGDTIRVSLTGDPVEEVRAALEILRSLGLAPGGPRLISCPTCGRTQLALEPLALEVERRLQGMEAEVEVAVMGCVVNGPGEARKADFGIAGGRGEGVIFARGRPVKKVPEDQLVEELFLVIGEWLRARTDREQGGTSG